MQVHQNSVIDCITIKKKKKKLKKSFFIFHKWFEWKEHELWSHRDLDWYHRFITYTNSVTLETDLICQCRRCRRHGFDPWVGKIPWRRKWQRSPIFLTGESHGQRSLVDCSPWGHKDPQLNTLHIHTCAGTEDVKYGTIEICKRI